MVFFNCVSSQSLHMGVKMVAVALDQYALGAIIVSVFTLIIAIYSFIAAKKKVARDSSTNA